MTPVKVSLIPNDFYTSEHGFEDVIEFCGTDGVKFIEIAYLWGKSVLDLGDDELNRVHEILDKHGVKVCSIQTQIMKVFPEGSKFSKKNSKNMHRDHQYNVHKIDAAIRMANEFDAKYIITYSYFTIVDPVTDELWQQLFTDYDFLVEKCENAGKTMVVECEGDTMISGTDEYLKLFERYKSESLKANLDLANFVSHVGAFTEEDFEKLKDHVEYFHVKDRILRKGMLSKLPIVGSLFSSKGAVFDEGMIPWREVLPWFIASGFDGYLSVEPHVHGKNKFQKATQCVKNLKKMLDELGIDHE
ncbi:MAG: sugar phosphate isomerase/epimerase family protein [Promethearchaeota archaeon]